MNTKLYNILKERGLLYQCTDEAELKKLLESGQPITLYEGTDLTADSLHIGHCVPFSILRRFQQAGHRVVLLMGGATTRIGDPSGKDEMRAILDNQTIDNNIVKIKESLKIFLDFDGNNPVKIVNNADWFSGYNYVDFMRDIGVHFNVNKMLSSDIYANRLEQGGLTFFEMGYMLMQAYDFVHLNKTENCVLQWGGSDQWGNIVAGVDLGRKLNFLNNTNNTFLGATNPLLVTPEGRKMGKTEKGAVWINKDKISAFDFYQGLYQTPDSCVEMMFSLFTDVPMGEVKQLMSKDIVNAKKVMSFEITKFVRGEADAKLAQEASEALFTGAGDLSNAPTFEITKTQLPIKLVDLLTMCKLVSSKSEGRRMCEQGGIALNGTVEKDFEFEVNQNDFTDNKCLIKKGKKSFMQIVLN